MPGSPDDSSPSNGSISAQRAAEVLARTMADSIARTKGQRNATAICRFEPSPTGIKQAVVSDAEFHVAVMDSDLEDASIGSGNSDGLDDSTLSDFC